MSIRKIWTIALVVSALVPVILVGGVSVALLNYTLESSFKQNLRSESESEANKYTNYFQERMDSTEALAALPDLAVALSRSNEGTSTSLAGTSYSRFSTEVAAQPSLCAILAVNREGIIVDASKDSFIGTKLDLPFNVLSVDPLQPFVTGILELPDVDNMGIPTDRQFGVLAPVYVGGHYQGYVMQVMDLSYFMGAKRLQRVFDTGFTLLADRDGGIATTNCDCEFRDVPSVSHIPGLSRHWNSDTFDAADSGFISYEVDGVARLAYYSVIPGAQWVTVSAVEMHELWDDTSRFSLAILAAVFIILALAYAAARVTVRRLLSPLDRITDAIHAISQGDLSARAEFTDASEIGQIARSFDELMDKLQLQTERLARSEERHRIVMEETEDVIFEWDVESDVIEFSPAWSTKFGQELTMTSASRGLFGLEIVKPADYGAFTDMLNAIFMEYRDVRSEYRIRNVDGEYVWVHVRSAMILDDKGQPVKAVGVVMDVNEHKVKEEILVSRSRRDELSSLYNRSGFESKVVVHLHDAERRGRRVAMMFIDIDDFKSFNDRYGHAFGDRVIRFIGEVLKRSADGVGFAGRLGGDEFALCVTDQAAVDDIESVAARIIDGLAEGLSVREDEGILPVRCSIGIAYYPSDGTTYAELIERSDAALYGAKDEGKGKYRSTTP